MAASGKEAMVWVRILEEGVFRFDASEAARAAAGPSLSFAVPRRREEPRAGGDRPAIVPVCEVVGDVQRVVVEVWPYGKLIRAGLICGEAEAHARFSCSCRGSERQDFVFSDARGSSIEPAKFAT
uniref:Uncharacterized protein n=1 Tax=Oryza rufipogon TaxID=4529 RepID=A0A0E0Q7B4_ORYRU